MILGIGIDLIALGRIRRAIERFGPRFPDRVLTRRERAAAGSDLAVRLAGRFAAKEAAAKALGTGLARGVGWQDLEILERPSGAPWLVLHGAARRRAEELGVTATHVSITHDREQAAAVVVLEAADTPEPRRQGRTEA